MFKIIDTDNSGSIEYQEFIRACISKEALFDENLLNFAFSFFDRQKIGQITIYGLNYIFSDENIIPERILKILVDEIDSNGDGQICYNDFKRMMRQLVS